MNILIFAFICVQKRLIFKKNIWKLEKAITEQIFSEPEPYR